MQYEQKLDYIRLLVERGEYDSARNYLYEMPPDYPGVQFLRDRIERLSNPAPEFEQLIEKLDHQDDEPRDLLAEIEGSPPPPPESPAPAPDDSTTLETVAAPIPTQPAIPLEPSPPTTDYPAPEDMHNGGLSDSGVHTPAPEASDPAYVPDDDFPEPEPLEPAPPEPLFPDPATLSPDEIFAIVRPLVQLRRYEEARDWLHRLAEHSKAQDWLRRLDKLVPPDMPSPPPVEPDKQLAKAREYIQQKQYMIAHMILQGLPATPQAQDWLRQLEATVAEERAAARQPRLSSETADRRQDTLRRKHAQATLLLNQRRYRELRELLQTVPDGPGKLAWLARLDRVAPIAELPPPEQQHNPATQIEIAMGHIHNRDYTRARLALYPVAGHPDAKALLKKLDDWEPLRRELRKARKMLEKMRYQDAYQLLMELPGDRIAQHWLQAMTAASDRQVLLQANALSEQGYYQQALHLAQSLPHNPAARTLAYKLQQILYEQNYGFGSGYNNPLINPPPGGPTYFPSG